MPSSGKRKFPQKAYLCKVCAKFHVCKGLMEDGASLFHFHSLPNSVSAWWSSCWSSLWSSGLPTILYWTIMYCTVLYNIVLYWVCTTLYCTVLYYIVLYRWSFWWLSLWPAGPPTLWWALPASSASQRWQLNCWNVLGSSPLVEDPLPY